jgi:hypothetical protein
MHFMVTYTKAAAERAMKVQEVLMQVLVLYSGARRRATLRSCMILERALQIQRLEGSALMVGYVF